MEKICPILAAARIIKGRMIETPSIPCVEDVCALWDEVRECCGLCAVRGGDDSDD